MNLMCQKCGNHVKETMTTISVKSELGFTIPATVYECEHCHEEHILCPECEGEGWVNILDPQDCPLCNGMGVISLKQVMKAMN